MQLLEPALKRATPEFTEKNESTRRVRGWISSRSDGLTLAPPFKSGNTM